MLEQQQFTSLNVECIGKQMMVFVVMQVVRQACIIIHEFDKIQDVPFNSTLQCKEHRSVVARLKFHPNSVVRSVQQ